MLRLARWATRVVRGGGGGHGGGGLGGGEEASYDAVSGSEYEASLLLEDKSSATSVISIN